MHHYKAAWYARAVIVVGRTEAIQQYVKLFVILGLIIIIVAIVVGIVFSTSSITNYPPKNAKIVAFGDSLVQGYGASKGGDFVAVLSRKLQRNIVNLGISGNTTEDGLQRIDDVIKEDPGIVILLLGGNDYLRRIPVEKTEENLALIIDALQSTGAVVVLLGVRGGIIIDGRDAMYESLSQQYNTVYVEDVLDGIFLKPELMFDGIHPNDAGYARIAERVYEVFIENNL